MENNFCDVTELAGDLASQEQVERLCHRYYWAADYSRKRDVVEVACGTGQGLGFLQNIASSLEAGDFSSQILSFARKHYGERIALSQFDAMDMPFEDNSKDVIILFEAIYYLPDAEKFIRECRRVLRPSGKVLISTANKDLYDFNPSPFSHKYYGTVEARDLFSKYGFNVELFGSAPITEASLRQKILRPIKKIVVSLGLMPKTMAGKKLLKRLVFGNLVTMPHEIISDTAEYHPPVPISNNQPDRIHKVIFCAATLK